MKKTPLVRKTPLKTHTRLKSKKGLSKSSSLSKGGMVKAKACSQNSTIAKEKKNTQIKNYGLKGKGRSESEKEHHSQLADKGCFVCNHLKIIPGTPLIIHHTDGRYQGGEDDISEWLTICLCYEHHDPSAVCGMSTKGLSVHHNKSLFKKLIGTELWCVYQSFALLDKTPFWIESSKWHFYLSLTDQQSQEEWIVENHNLKVQFNS